jgi:FtsZ-interacting cell division protein YlmF
MIKQIEPSELKKGDIIHNNCSGKVVLKVVKVYEDEGRIIFEHLKNHKAYTLDFESIKKHWSLGKPTKSWYVRRRHEGIR